MVYRKIDPRIWDDEKFVEWDLTTRFVWIYLLTGRHTTSLPGLWFLSAAEIAEGMRLPVQAVEASLEALVKDGRVRIDRKHRLIMVPRAPKYNYADNARSIQAWWKQWSNLPTCSFKFEHLINLREGVQSDKVREAWQAVFGEQVSKLATMELCQGDAAPPPSSSRPAQPPPSSPERFRKSSSAPATAPVGLPRICSPEEDPDTARAHVADVVPAKLTDPPPAPPAAPPTEAVAPDQVPQAPAEILAELRKHPPLAQAATSRVAEMLLGRAIQAGKRMAWVAEAIADCARDAASDDAAERPWGASLMAKSLAKYVDRARAPRPAQGPRLPRGAPRAPAAASPDVEARNERIRRERIAAERAEQQNQPVSEVPFL